LALDRRKRFYAKAEVAQSETGFAVTLDGRTPRSPEGRSLTLPTRGLAELVAQEWAAQGAEIAPATMISTRLAWTGLAYAEDEGRDVATARLGEYAGADLLCYFADGPEALVERQQRQWTPLIDWAEIEFGVAFSPARGIVHQAQPEATLQRFRDLARAENAFALAGLATAAPLFGSAILAFALRYGRLDAKAALALSRLDEAFQEERWGVDAEAAERNAAMAAEAAMLERWFAAL
jgi:chaperone required for assembly of F1-ATPase